ncbi:hypothetical protein PoB_006659600 [Plakobranchus ocellatus]|uniref:Uncharacterized protein n=1 Tax=Plakobranchus ocellatus TaxID=259542 RepID=A0AAV4D7F9_9GAST|nr:hypothetical protein PoB_006659600 [Plakobranchus ocellatus]
MLMYRGPMTQERPADLQETSRRPLSKLNYQGITSSETVRGSPESMRKEIPKKFELTSMLYCKGVLSSNFSPLSFLQCLCGVKMAWIEQSAFSGTDIGDHVSPLKSVLS